MSEGRGDVEVVEAGGGGDDGLDVVSAVDIWVGGGVEVADKEGAPVVVGWQDDVTTAVFLLTREIIEHNKYIYCSISYRDHEWNHRASHGIFLYTIKITSYIHDTKYRHIDKCIERSTHGQTHI